MTEPEPVARLVRTPGVRSGQPALDGSRLTASDILGILAQGLTFDEIVADYPQLDRASLVAVLEWAQALIAAASAAYDAVALVPSRSVPWATLQALGRALGDARAEEEGREGSPIGLWAIATARPSAGEAGSHAPVISLIQYDASVDAAWLSVNDELIFDHQVRLDDARAIDYDADGAVLGIELLSPRRRGVKLEGLPFAEDIARVLRAVGFPISDGKLPGA